MNEQEARALAAEIQPQVPMHILSVVQTSRGSWVIGVMRGLGPDEETLVIASRHEWECALKAWRMLRD